MRTQLCFQIFLIPFYLILLGVNSVLVSGECQIGQESILIQLKNQLQFNSSVSTKLVSWNPNVTTDCCKWEGVNCNSRGQVVGLDLSNETISGGFDDSNDLFDLENLEDFNLAGNRFSFIQIPSKFGSLASLKYLNLSNSGFSGHIPSFQQCKNLTHIDLSRNSLSGLIPSAYFQDLQNLVSVDLRFNAFNGSIPSSLFSLRQVQKIQLSNNNFDGELANFSNPSASLLDTLDLSSNNLEGKIPRSFFELRWLSILLLSSNKLSGMIETKDFQSLTNLTTLDLSFNNLTIITNSNISGVSHLPMFSSLKLASCNLQEFPHLQNQSRLITLDLSSNKINGEIPSWIWSIGNGSLSFMNLSHNHLTSLQKPYQFSSLIVLDFHFNELSGEIPIPPTATFIDYSDNRFHSDLPESIGINLGFAYFFSVSNNLLTGMIPDSICNASYLKVLNLSNNRLNGTIPQCLIEFSGSLGVLNLGNNSLSGRIEGTFPSSCGLNTLDLHGNYLEGKILPSLINCTMLEVLNLGNNKINDTYPCSLGNHTNLRVLVLRSNMFHGTVRCGEGPHNKWQKLQILDIALNNFSGEVPEDCFWQWGAMMSGEQSRKKHLSFMVLQLNDFYYQDTVTVTVKGLELELVKILTIFTSIDISNNHFSGKIPSTIGRLKELYLLNVSHNDFTGSIPSSIGNLSQLESLDMSSNQLTGEIPSVLTKLPVLSAFDLSYNQLEGQIPTGSQFQTFSEASYKGNKGLCGFPLDRSCISSVVPVPVPSSAPSSGDDWQPFSQGMGVGAGLSMVITILGCLRKGDTAGTSRRTNLRR